MSSLTCRSDHYVVVLLTTISLLSLSCSVIAQDKAKEIDISTYKIKLSLSHLPREINRVDAISPPDFVDNKASLKISSSKNQGLLFSYLSDDIKVSGERPLENEIKEDPTVTQPLAYVMSFSSPPIIDRNKWDSLVKAKYKNGLIRTIVPGVKHISIKKGTNAGPMSINVVEINPALNQNLEITPALAGITLPNVKRVNGIVNQNDAIVGINASFFKPTTGVPLGTLIIKEELITGPIYDRVTLGIKDNKFRMARISLQGKVITQNGEEIKIDNVNQPRMLASYNIIYSYRWGKMAPPCPKYGIQVAIDNGRIINVSKERLAIPPSGYVIVGPQKILGALNIDDPVQIAFLTAPDWSDIQHAISGGPYLVKNGQVYVDIKDQKLGSISGRNPRTAVGYTMDNRLIMVTVDGRQKGSVGATLYELARIMREYGCYNAMNLDGGSSTQMIVKGRVVNRPLSQSGNFVSNGLIVKVND